MSGPLVFMDTETTGFALTDDIWEFAAIRREEDGEETTLHLFIDHDTAKCRDLPGAFLEDHLARFPGHQQFWNKKDAAWAIFRFIEGAGGSAAPKAHIVGAVPNFDTERVAQMFRLQIEQKRAPWHHHLIDVEALSLGWLAGRGKAIPTRPWSSDDLSRLVGVEPPTEGRHTAMGDAEWARDLYDAIFRIRGGAS